MINGIVINKNKLSKKPIGVILGSDADNNRFQYKNIIISYINGQSNIPILIKTNLTQEQWDYFCDGRLSKQELEKYI